MPRRARFLALPLGFLLAVAIGACGSSDSRESGATLAPPPERTQATTAPATTAATVTTTAQTTTVPPSTSTATTPAAPTTTQPSGGAAPATQPSGGAPAACPSVVGGFIRDVRATDCGVARAVATAWFDAVHGGAAPDSTVEVAGYSCSATLAGERASVACSGSGGSVAFTASP